jgi:glutaredoxin
MNKRFIPLLFIAALIVTLFMIVGRYSVPVLSEQPLVLHQQPPQIILFGTRDCPYCELAKAFFHKHNLPYIEHDIETSDEQRKMFDLLGGQGTPLLIINKQLIHGFDEQAMREAL